MRLFPFTRDIGQGTVLVFVARMALLGLVMIDNLTESQNFMVVCVGKLAVTLLAKGCIRMFIRVVLFVLLRIMCLANSARYAE